MMMEGTQNKTPQELEEAIDKLGASIYMYASNGSISISVNTLARNYKKFQSNLTRINRMNSEIGRLMGQIRRILLSRRG